MDIINGRRYPYYRYEPNLSGEGRKIMAKYLEGNIKLIVEDFYFSTEGVFEGEAIYHDELE